MFVANIIRVRALDLRDFLHEMDQRPEAKLEEQLSLLHDNWEHFWYRDNKIVWEETPEEMAQQRALDREFQKLEDENERAERRYQSYLRSLGDFE